jgi:3-methylcrotonyl-CoA carboxylase alpha subunit
MMFKKVLIANRGEIACRIIKTLNKMGITSVAIYSTADEFSPHVKMADEAYCVGEAAPLKSYLNIENILEVAKKAKVCAIHPGYGFLSENPEFAEQVAKHNMVFIGPNPQAMRDVGSKQRAKEMLSVTNVPLIPGFNPANPSDEALFEAAEKMGWPVVLKAAHGGGGKGLKIVKQTSEFDHAIQSARREALSYFNNDELLLEKLIENPRHLEVQVIADHHGNVLHLFERDCSVQRRQQKIIEEAPAIGLSASLRKKLYAYAIEVVKTFNYTNAGTVEFLLAPQETLYFMEMNARLQVEHPITEMITGLDLVEWQIRIASGEPLTIPQPQTPNGHAIECRICAEIPEKDFKPSQGQITDLKWPDSSSHTRVDAGIENLQIISSHYDSLLAKTIAWQPSREKAVVLAQQMLNDTTILGVETNIEYLYQIMEHPVWQQGAVPIDFLSRHDPKPNPLPKNLQQAMLAVADSIHFWQNTTLPKSFSSFAISGPRFSHKIFEHQDKSCVLAINYQKPGQVQWQQDGLETIDYQYQAPLVFFNYKNKAYRYKLEFKKDLWLIHNAEQVLSFKPVLAESMRHKKQQGCGGVTSPMPATIVAIFKNNGDDIHQGEPLLVLEAMKMEHTIYAPFNGVVKQLFYQLGQQVQEGQQLLELAQTSESK